jgi:uncharacterized membrane protein
MAEAQQAHLIKSEQQMIAAQIDITVRGQRYGLCIAIFVLIVAGVFAYLGYSSVAITTVLSEIVALVGCFVYQARASTAKK